MKNWKQEFIEAARKELKLEERRIELEAELRSVTAKLEKTKIRKMSAFIALEERPPYFVLLNEAIG